MGLRIALSSRFPFFLFFIISVFPFLVLLSVSVFLSFRCLNSTVVPAYLSASVPLSWFLPRLNHVFFLIPYLLLFFFVFPSIRTVASIFSSSFTYFLTSSSLIVQLPLILLSFPLQITSPFFFQYFPSPSPLPTPSSRRVYPLLPSSPLSPCPSQELLSPPCFT